MTCVVGVEYRGRVWIGADSVLTASNRTIKSGLSKIAPIGNMLWGFSGNPREWQLIEHGLQLQEQSPGQTDLAYLSLTLTKAILEVFENYDLHLENGNMESSFLIGYKGALYCLYNDFQIVLPADGFYAVGSGAHYALGSLHTQAGRGTAEKQITKALEAASFFSPSVGGEMVLSYI